MSASAMTSERSLPDGWRWAKLEEICRVFAGSAAPQGGQYFSEHGPSFFRVSDIGAFGRTKELTEARDKLSSKALNDCHLVFARTGTVLFPKSGAAVATNNRALLACDGYIVSHLMALEPNEFVMSEWLYYAVCNIDMIKYSDNTGYPSLKQSVAAKIEIPLPPLNEQHRIIALLNEHMGVVEIAKAAVLEQLAAIDALPDSCLRMAFAGEL